MKLYIGNKNYSSWSLRPWLLMRATGIPFEEVKLRFDFAPGSAFRNALAAVAPVSRVPVLVEDDGFAVWDSLAIAEYLAERHPEKVLWPADARARARARSVCAEMHGGFADLRQHCPMNIEAALPEVGARLLREFPGVAADLARIVDLWGGALADHGGPFLFGGFGIADAYYAPVCLRIETYRLPVPAVVRGYLDRLLQLPALVEWIGDALAEHDYIGDDEPYRGPT